MKKLTAAENADWVREFGEPMKCETCKQPFHEGVEACRNLSTRVPRASVEAACARSAKPVSSRCPL